METKNKTASQILTEAADYLENEGKWGQGSYFKFEQKTEQSNSPACVMCAHGAIAYCGNPEVKSKIVFDLDGVMANIIAGTAAADAVFFENSGLHKDVIRKLIHKHYKGEIGLAHYQAAKVGLTFEFNDTPGRTKREVIAKLREAADISVE